MAFFADDVITESTSIVLEQIEAVPCYIENYHEAVLAAVAENESNYNMLMKNIGIHEYSSYKATGQVVYTEGAIQNFWEKVKKFFAAVYAKLKGIFQSFMSRFDTYWKSGKSFFDKYKKPLVEKFGKLDKDKIKFMGYNFVEKRLGEKNTVLGGGVVTQASKFFGESRAIDPGSMTAEIGKKITDGREKLDDELEKYRGSLVGGKGALTQSEFTKELFEYFRGDNQKSEQDGITFEYIAGILSNDKLSKNVSDTYKQLEKDVNELIRVCEKGQKESIDKRISGTDAEKGVAEHTTGAYPILISAFKGILDAKKTFLGAQMQAIKDCVGQAKTFAAQVLRGPVKESGSWETYGEGAYETGSSFLSNVVFK